MKLKKNIALLASVLATTTTVFAADFNCKDSNAYTKITTAKQLLQIGSNADYPMDGRYCIVNDLDFNNEPNESINEFTGHLVGAYNDNKKPVVLKNLAPVASQAGLIQTLSGRLDNIHIRDSRITGMMGASLVYEMVGDSKISNSSVANTEIRIIFNAGGLVAYMKGNSAIENSYVNAKFLGNDAIPNMFVGGIAYQLEGKSSISNSYAMGLFANLLASGGIAAVANGGSFDRTYSSFTVSNLFSPHRRHGGLIPNNNFRSCSNSYWDRTDNYDRIDNNCAQNGGSSGRESRSMRQQQNYVNWDFNNVWQTGSNGYPDLIHNSRDN